MPDDSLDVLDTSDLDNGIEDVSLDGVGLEDQSADGDNEGESASDDNGAEDESGEGAEGEEGQPQSSQPPQSAKPQAPAQKQEPEFFLNENGIVYKTKEEAINSHQYKNNLITQLRNQIIASSGVDPITNRPVQGAQPRETRPSPVDDWTKTPDNYFLEAAKDPVGANMKLIDHYVGQYVAPVVNDLLEAMSEMQLELHVSRFANAKVRGEDGTSKLANEGFQDFLESGGMEKVLQENPDVLNLLIQAKQGRKYKDFGNILKTAFSIYKGTKTGDIAKKVADQTASKMKQQFSKNKKAVTEKPASGGKAVKSGTGDKLKDLESKLSGVRF